MIDDPHGIQRAREARGWTERELARRPGVPYQRIQSLEKATPKGGKTYSRYLPQVLAALESDAAPADNPRFKTVGLPNDLPVYALRPNQSGGVEKTATIVASVPRPNKVRSVPDAYAVRVWGSDMAPKYRPGDDLAVDPIAPPRPQCGVLLISKEKHVVEIGDFVAEGADLWMVQKFGETPATMTFSRLDYPIVHVVCGVYPDR